MGRKIDYGTDSERKYASLLYRRRALLRAGGMGASQELNLIAGAAQEKGRPLRAIGGTSLVRIPRRRVVSR